MKKTLSILLSAVMIITSIFVLPSTAMAATSGNCGTNAKYTYDLTAGTLVISGSGEMTDYSASSKAPWNNADCIQKITSITINSGVTSIGASAFQMLSQVADIRISDTVKTIGERAFDSCAVGATPITLTIPSSVEKIGVNAFRGMSKLAAFSVNTSNNHYKSVEGVLYDKNCTTLIQVPSRLNMTELTLPETVTTISANALYKVFNVKKLFVPAGVNTVAGTSLANSASSVFEGTTDITVYYPENSAFDWNIYLKNIGVDGEPYGEWCRDGISRYEEEIIAPTCTRRGYTLHTCKVCGVSYKDNFTDEIDHDYNKSIVSPTCTEQGYTIHTCKVCGISYYDNYKNATGHTPVTDKAVAATCTKTGKSAGSHCSVCGTVINAQKTVAKKEHSYKTTTTTKATTSKNGTKVTKCTVCGTKKSTTTIYKASSIKLSKTSYVYDGKAKKPTVTVKTSKGKKLVLGTDYTVKYSSNTKVGKATAIITFKGDYKGTVSKTFTIKPKSTSISKLTKKIKGFTVKWNKKTTQTTGYEIQYATNSSFTKNKKTVTVKNNKTTSKTISNLKANKKYYVRIRTYKTVKINGKSTKIYSSWSKAKSVTTAKATTPKKQTTVNNKSNTVYVTPTGKRYHYISTCGGKNSRADTLNAAVSRGLTPCSKCAK